nr:replication factor C subunit 2 [Ipomoea trifida]
MDGNRLVLVLEKDLVYFHRYSGIQSRPKQVKDVAHQDEVVRVLTNTLETANCPHMLFYGPPGTGKTTTALAIAHQLFGPEMYKSRVLELNASDDRGINVVRTKIKNFAAVAVGSGHQRIIEPLASRCAKFRFKPLTEEIMSSRILHICNEEGLNLDSESAARLFGSSISSRDLITVSGVIPEEVVHAIFSACKSGNFDLADKEVNNVIAEGYPASQMLSQLYDLVVEADDISDEQKARICKKLGETDKFLVDGADEYLQLLDVASITMQTLCNMPQEMTY